jgi:DUF971 family protein
MHADTMPHVETYEIIGDFLALRWLDGAEQYIPLRTLRDACPCAVCTGEPTLTQPARAPRDRHPPAEGYRLVSLEPVGAYALCPRWGDGHATGIYSFAYLRALPPEP